MGNSKAEKEKSFERGIIDPKAKQLADELADSGESFPYEIGRTGFSEKEVYEGGTSYYDVNNRYYLERDGHIRVEGHHIEYFIHKNGYFETREEEDHCWRVESLKEFSKAIRDARVDWDAAEIALCVKHICS